MTTTTDKPAGDSVAGALAKRDNGPGALVQQYRDDFATVLPTHIKADQWVRLSVGLMRRSPELAKVAQRNPGSFLAAMLDCARLGLEPGETYHLVAFGNEIVGIIDWTGEVELIYRAGAVSSVKAEIVYANDDFSYDSSMDRPHHKPDWFGDRGEMVGVYAYAVMKDGATSRVVVMSRTDIDRVMAVSKTARSRTSPWQQWPDRMWLKTAVKQLAKWVPSSAEYREQALRAAAAAEQTSIPAAPVSPRDDLPLPAGSDVVDAEIVENGAAEAGDPPDYQHPDGDGSTPDPATDPWDPQP